MEAAPTFSPKEPVLRDPRAHGERLKAIRSLPVWRVGVAALVSAGSALALPQVASSAATTTQKPFETPQLIEPALSSVGDEELSPLRTFMDQSSGADSNQRRNPWAGAKMNCTTEVDKPRVFRAGEGYSKESSGFISCIETKRGYVARQFIEICMQIKTIRGWRTIGGSLVGCTDDIRLGAGFHPVSVKLPCNLDLDRRRPHRTIIRPIPPRNLNRGAAWGVTVTNRYAYSKPLVDESRIPC